jgi:hypothetical protein
MWQKEPCRSERQTELERCNVLPTTDAGWARGVYKRREGYSAAMMVEESLRVKILIGVVGPPIVTTICWLVGPLLAGARRKRTRTRDWVQFWLMLIAAYLVFAIALAGGHLFTGNDQVDPSQLVR